MRLEPSFGYCERFAALLGVTQVMWRFSIDESDHDTYATLWHSVNGPVSYNTYYVNLLCPHSINNHMWSVGSIRRVSDRGGHTIYGIRYVEIVLAGELLEDRGFSCRGRIPPPGEN